MRIFLSAAFILMALASLTTAQAAESTISLKRVPIVVSDMERSLKVYRDILKLTVESDNLMTPNAHDERVFNVPPGGLSRSVKFNLGPDQVRAIGLFEIKSYRGRSAEEIHDHGVVFRTTRIDDIYAQVKAGGYRVVDFVDLKTNAGEMGRELTFLDPDGHLVLVYQIDR